ncbi:hypothetical protein AN958_10112 [Leucoagaricus sp. SymC.cos]|nr:hypothetical protein AN958_10112 [Leucoagaricus sp. SymC.cos]
MWAPNLQAYVWRYVCKLFKKSRFRKRLRRISPKSFYICASPNDGPTAYTIQHQDNMNLAFGWCAVVALSQFDHTRGGHLVFDDLHLTMEFPPNSIVLLLSAMLYHCNVPVRENEQCASLTFYNPASIFQYIDNGFMTEKQLWKNNHSRFMELQHRKPTRYLRALRLFSTLDELSYTIDSGRAKRMD